MQLTDTRVGNKARLVSPYIDTTGKCLELFYWLRCEHCHSDRTYISVIAITEEHREDALHETYDLSGNFPRLYLHLPNGTHRIAIEGKRSETGSSALSLDDVTIMYCDRFGKIINLITILYTVNHRRGYFYFGLALSNSIYLFQTTRSIATQLRERDRQTGTKKTDYIETNTVVEFTTTAHYHSTEHCTQNSKLLC